MATSSSTKATQDFVPIKDVKDGIVRLKDGSLRSILMASSINFALKSQDEQESVIYQFQNFLNSLNFSVQICIQSRKLDIGPYLSLLKEKEKEQTNDLMKLQVKQYIEFVQTLTDNSNIMTKTFFVVIPYNTSAIQTGSNTIDNVLKKNDKNDDDQKTFDEHKIQLSQRVAVVEEGLTRCGIRVVELDTEQLTELYYKSFNPGEVNKPVQEK